MTTSHRRSLVMQRLAEIHETDTVVVSNLTNIRYLTGFAGSHAVLGMRGERTVLVTDDRYALDVRSLPEDIEILLNRSSLQVVIEWFSAGQSVMQNRPRCSLGFEADHLSVSQFEDLESFVGSTYDLVPTSGLVEQVRIVKNEDELDLIRRACDISTRALESVLPTIQIGDTEAQIARGLESAMLMMGAEAIAFDTIVAAGTHSAQPHHRPCDRQIREGDLLVIDFGARLGGYHSDQTRTFSVGEPQEWAVEAHQAVSLAAEAARGLVRSGETTVRLDQAARAVLSENSMDQLFTHGLGHGVGLQVHEAPMIGSRSTGMLTAGSVITIEPGVYAPDIGGVRVEDCCVVLESGVEVLTSAPRTLRRVC